MQRAAAPAATPAGPRGGRPAPAGAAAENPKAPCSSSNSSETEEEGSGQDTRARRTGRHKAAAEADTLAAALADGLTLAPGRGSLTRGCAAAADAAPTRAVGRATRSRPAAADAPSGAGRRVRFHGEAGDALLGAAEGGVADDGGGCTSSQPCPVPPSVVRHAVGRELQAAPAVGRNPVCRAAVGARSKAVTKRSSQQQTTDTAVDVASPAAQLAASSTGGARVGGGRSAPAGPPPAAGVQPALVLVPDGLLQQLPWEALPGLQPHNISR
jgi:hypothetical protein